jgi:hypothetical protein
MPNQGIFSAHNGTETSSTTTVSATIESQPKVFAQSQAIPDQQSRCAGAENEADG